MKHTSLSSTPAVSVKSYLKKGYLISKENQVQKQATNVGTLVVSQACNYSSTSSVCDIPSCSSPPFIRSISLTRGIPHNKSGLLLAMCWLEQLISLVWFISNKLADWLLTCCSICCWIFQLLYALCMIVVDRRISRNSSRANQHLTAVRRKVYHWLWHVISRDEQLVSDLTLLVYLSQDASYMSRRILHV